MPIVTRKLSDRVSASVNPTNRIIAKRARDSSGRIPLYTTTATMNINFSVKLFYITGGLK